MSWREAFSDQIDSLLGEALGNISGEEIAAAVEGRGIGALRAAAGVDGPVVDAVFEAAVGQEIGVDGRKRLIGDRVAGIDGGAGEALAGD